MFAIDTLDTLEFANPRRAEQTRVAGGYGPPRRTARSRAGRRPSGEVAASAAAVIAVILTSCVAAGGLGGSQPRPPGGIVHQGGTYQQTTPHGPDVTAAP